MDVDILRGMKLVFVAAGMLLACVAVAAVEAWLNR
jgi:hypothetical protein